MTDVDVLVIGTGNAGQAAAGAARAAGRSVAVVERRDVGGTCAIRGCVPKKVLVAAAETLEAIRGAAVHGIAVGEPTVDWPALVARVRSFVSAVPGEVEASFRRRGIEVVHGAARFVAPGVVDVDGRRFAAGVVVVATGATPRALAMQGAAHAVTSDALFELPALPRSIVFVGGGVIAFEFAHVFARMGVQVSILELAPRVLGPVDAAVAERLVAATRAIGAEVRAGVAVEAIAPAPGGFVVRGRSGNEPFAIEAELVVNAAGRVPAVADLALAEGGVAVDARGLPLLDDLQRSASAPAVVFAGDALPGTPQLSPLASIEGRAAWAASSGGSPGAPDPVPSAVFTVPPLAMVGLTLEGAERLGLDVEVRDNDVSTWRSSRTYGDGIAFARVVLERGTGRIVGAHLLGRAAPEVVHAFTFAMKLGLRADDLKQLPIVYPTFHADVKHLLA